MDVVLVQDREIHQLTGIGQLAIIHLPISFVDSLILSCSFFKVTIRWRLPMSITTKAP